MIKLFGFGSIFGIADPSPFVLKIDAYMRMAGIEFESFSDFSNLNKAPKGKLPYIDDSGLIVADSFFILAHLHKKYGAVLDESLSDEQKATSSLIIKSLDENFYWCIVYSRWLRDDTWPVVKEAFFSTMPFLIKQIVPLIARKGVKSAFVKHGMGKHNDEEIMQIAASTLENLSTLLANKTYFFGESASTLDAAAYAFLSQVTISTIDNPLGRLARKYGNLVAYCERIKQKYYSNNVVS